MNLKDSITVSVASTYDEDLARTLSVYITSPTLDIVELPLREAERINNLLTKVFTQLENHESNE